MEPADSLSPQLSPSLLPLCLPNWSETTCVAVFTGYRQHITLGQDTWSSPYVFPLLFLLALFFSWVLVGISFFWIPVTDVVIPPSCLFFHFPPPCFLAMCGLRNIYCQCFANYSLLCITREPVCELPGAVAADWPVCIVVIVLWHGFGYTFKTAE